MREIVIEVVPPPGTYGDGPAYLRVNRALAGDRWPRPWCRAEVRDAARIATVADDPEHDYLPAGDSHSAYVYRNWLRSDGVPIAASTVVRLRTAK